MTTTPIENSLINLWCLKDVMAPRGIGCGCPECCARDGLTALFCVEDFKPGVYPLEWWPKVVCTEKLALLCQERICPGWPGSPWKEGKRCSVEPGGS